MVINSLEADYETSGENDDGSVIGLFIAFLATNLFQISGRCFLQTMTLFTVVFLLSSCSGGSDENSTTSPLITSAETFDEYLSQLKSYNDRGLNTISASEIASYFSYNNQLSDFQNDSSVKSISNSMDGVYHNFVQPGEVNSLGQLYENIWPSFPNGEFTLVPVNPSYSRITNARDLTNKQTLEGDFKLFFGIKETEFFGTSSQRVPVLILMEGVVKLRGEPQYRTLNVYEGYLYESDISNGPSFNGVPGYLFSGTYSQYAIEAFNGGSTGHLLTYEAYFIRQSGGPIENVSKAWGTSELIGLGGSPEIAIDGNDVVHVTWNNGANISTKRYTASGWGSGETLSSKNVSSLRLKMVADNNGNAHAIWQDWYSTLSRTVTLASRYTVVNGWDSPQLIDTYPSNNIGVTPHLAIDNSGNAFAVWGQIDDVSFSVWGNRYDVSSGWSTARVIDNTSYPTGAEYLTVDNTGNAFVVFNNSDGILGPGQPAVPPGISANRFTVSSGWGVAQNIVTKSIGSDRITLIGVTGGNNGNAIVVWEYSDDLWSSYYTDGIGWGVPQLIEFNSGFVGNPKIVSNDNGNTLVVWTQNDRIWVNRFTASVGWTGAQLIDNNTATFSFSAQVDIDSSGNAFAMWLQRDNTGTQDIAWSSRYSVSSGWGIPQPIDSSFVDSYTNQITFDSSGNALFVWKELKNGQTSINGSYYNKSSGRGESQSIVTSSAVVSSPQIVFDSVGNVLAVWEQRDGAGNSSIWANRFE